MRTRRLTKEPLLEDQPETTETPSLKPATSSSTPDPQNEDVGEKHSIRRSRKKEEPDSYVPRIIVVVALVVVVMLSTVALASLTGSKNRVRRRHRSPPSIKKLIHKPIPKPTEVFCESSIQIPAELNLSRPINFTIPTTGAIPLIFPSQRNETYPTCVNNPLIQAVITSTLAENDERLFDFTRSYLDKRDDKSIRIPECPPSYVNPVGDHRSFLNDKVIVLSTNSSSDARAFVEISRKLRDLGFTDVEKFIGVNGASTFSNCTGHSFLKIKSQPGAMGIRDGFKKLILYAMAKNLERFIVFENDAVFADDFEESLDKAAHCNRCGGYMFDPNAGGALILGASEYKLHDAKRDLVRARNAGLPDGCYNANFYTYGAFAVIYHRNIYVPMLEFLEDPLYNGAPYDHMWGYLGLRGFRARVLHPMIGLADVLHASSSSKETIVRKFRDRRDLGYMLFRACSQGWPLQNYRFYSDFLEKSRLQFSLAQNCSTADIAHYQSPYRVVLLVVIKDVSNLRDVVAEVKRSWVGKLDGRHGVGVSPVVVLSNPNVPAQTKKKPTKLSFLDFWVNRSNMKVKLARWFSLVSYPERQRVSLLNSAKYLNENGIGMFIVGRSNFKPLLRRYRAKHIHLFQRFFVVEDVLPTSDAIEAVMSASPPDRLSRFVWHKLKPSGRGLDVETFMHLSAVGN